MILKTPPKGRRLSLYVDVREPAKFFRNARPTGVSNSQQKPGEFSVSPAPGTDGSPRPLAPNRRPSGDYSAVVPPVPIPNTEVKRCSPDDSASLGCAKVGRRQSHAPLFLPKERGSSLVSLERSTSGGGVEESRGAS